jgi:tetratricopeptide (TPR) repeat protein
MFVATILASALIVQAPVSTGDVEVAYRETVEGRSEAAIRKIEAADERQADHPARLINLGIAHARLGDEERARELFREAASNTQRYWLETSEGRWADAREIARVALAKLDRGELAATQLASR